MAEVTTSALVAYELLRGVRGPREREGADELLDLLRPLELDLQAAEAAADLTLRNRGILLSDRATADALIAGTAIAHQATLITLNTRQFSRLQMPGLDLLLIDQRATDWTDWVP